MISLCMATKDEEMTVLGCIESVQNIVDEVVVVDTGSTDRTVEIVKTLGAKVIMHELKDDFGMVRNLSLRAASEDWILVLDADERIEKDDLPTLRNLAVINKCVGYFLPWHTYLRDGRKLVDYKLNFFRNIPEVYYEGFVHENVTNSIRKLNGLCEMVEVTIHHYPVWVKMIREKKERKYEELLSRQVSLNPNDSRTLWFLGRTYHRWGMRQKAAREFEQAIQSLSRPVEALQASLGLAQIYIEENHISKAMSVLEEAERIYFDYKNDIEVKVNASLLRTIQQEYQTLSKIRIPE